MAEDRRENYLLLDSKHLSNHHHHHQKSSTHINSKNKITNTTKINNNFNNIITWQAREEPGFYLVPTSSLLYTEEPGCLACLASQGSPLSCSTRRIIIILLLLLHTNSENRKCHPKERIDGAAETNSDGWRSAAATLEGGAPHLEASRRGQSHWQQLSATAD